MPTITAEEEAMLRQRVDDLQTGRAKPRNPMDVIDRLLQVVPPIETSLRAHIVSIKRWLLFAAPEIADHAWGKLETVLVEVLGEPTQAWEPDGWQLRVGRIMRAEE